ncbi:helix-turn-helix transcriptional regulator [Synechococcus sp. PROS-U-1]|uniref:helix-turn-helix transcriptional regulator n=1 Tax=Synechococcus sp. PROS-U-1 TaxID=1400866 RepID=UPI001649793B|nr:helix-turn-helix transcriptional regulator [Synechococcus sp. PROS-U-1]QNJ02703.1 transcriptional regulator/ AraC family [Synechococcus sp. PROS-U-1]
MKLDFNSARGLSATLRTLGFEMDVAQLSQGALNGVFRLGGSRQLPVFSIQTNQDLVLHGNRRPGVLPISLNTSDQNPVVRGEETQQGSLHGFHASLSDTFVQLPAGAHIQVALVSQTRFEQLACSTGEHQVLDLIQGSNSANLSPQRFAQISALIQAQLMGADQEDLIQAATLEALSPQELRGTTSGELGVGSALMKDLVSWGFENTRQAIRLDDLSATIFASRSSIVQHCRQTFGTGPMTLLKQIRLAQVQHALGSSKVQQAIGCRTVQEIASHYGFPSRNHFARDYRNQFGESPSATLQRESDPGMRLQSVSVAQSPQIAMARR